MILFGTPPLILIHTNYACSSPAAFETNSFLPPMTAPPPGPNLREVLQRGVAESEEGVPASQGQDPRVQHLHGYRQQDRG